MDTKGTSLTVDMSMASAPTVEAFLRFMYTGDIQDIDPFELLPLAHHYQMRPLLYTCGHTLLEHLSVSNAVAIVQALRTFRHEDNELELVWEHLVHRIQQDGQLLRQVLEQCVQRVWREVRPPLAEAVPRSP